MSIQDIIIKKIDNEEAERKSVEIVLANQLEAIQDEIVSTAYKKISRQVSDTLVALAFEKAEKDKERVPEVSVSHDLCLSTYEDSVFFLDGTDIRNSVISNRPDIKKLIAHAVVTYGSEITDYTFTYSKDVCKRIIYFTPHISKVTKSRKVWQKKYRHTFEYNFKNPAISFLKMLLQSPTGDTTDKINIDKIILYFSDGEKKKINLIKLGGSIEKLSKIPIIRKVKSNSKDLYITCTQIIIPIEYNKKNKSKLWACIGKLFAKLFKKKAR